MYDFHKTKDQNGKVFHHPNFIRGKRYLLKNIKRNTAGAVIIDSDLVQNRSDSVSTQDVNTLVN